MENADIAIFVCKHVGAMSSLRSALDKCPPAPTQMTCQELKNATKRIRAVEIIQDGPLYQTCAGVAADRMPGAPDPTTASFRLMSKRKWEITCMDWKKSLLDLRAALIQEGMIDGTWSDRRFCGLR